MKNTKLESIDKSKKNYLLNKYINNDRVFLLYLNGNKIFNQKDYFLELYKKMDIPLITNLDAYVDIMTDSFSYKEANTIIVIIDYYKNFLKDEILLKEEIKEIFNEEVFPYFKNFKKIKKYKVYFVDS